MTSYIHTETCGRMFTAAGFTKVQMWKQPKHPWIEGRTVEGGQPLPREWLRRKSKAVLSGVATRVENTMSGTEARHRKLQVYASISTMCPQQANPQRQKVEERLRRGAGSGATADMHRPSFRVWTVV